MLPVTFVAQDQEPEVLPVGDLLQLCFVTELVLPRLQNQGKYSGKIASGKGWSLGKGIGTGVPAFSQCYSKWCGSTVRWRCRVGQESACPATRSTLNFQPATT